jgi:hypothetical protein
MPRASCAAIGGACQLIVGVTRCSFCFRPAHGLLEVRDRRRGHQARLVGDGGEREFAFSCRTENVLLSGLSGRAHVRVI